MLMLIVALFILLAMAPLVNQPTLGIASDKKTHTALSTEPKTRKQTHKRHVSKKARNPDTDTMNQHCRDL